MGREKAYWISLITVTLNYALRREMLFAHEENKVGSRDHRGNLPLQFLSTVDQVPAEELGCLCKNYLRGHIWLR